VQSSDPDIKRDPSDQKSNAFNGQIDSKVKPSFHSTVFTHPLCFLSSLTKWNLETNDMFDRMNESIFVPKRILFWEGLSSVES
jgi:hypothetical protein